MHERYKRQIQLEDIGVEGQKKLQKAAVLIVGVGGLGSAISLYLAAAGIGKIGLIDDDFVSLSNLQRQILYSEAEIGLPKVKCAKNRLNQLNSETNIEIFDAKFDKKNAKNLTEKFDIIVDGSDNFATRYLINDICVELGKPYIYGSIEEFSGQVSVFNYNFNENIKSKNYRDLFPNETELINGKTTISNGVLGVLPGIIGSIEANEVIKIITGTGEVLANKLFTIDLLSMETNVVTF
jgi:adenylyltransferase/sulfurtransferase